MVFPGSSSAQEFMKYFHTALGHPVKTYVSTALFLPSICYTSILLTPQIGKVFEPLSIQKGGGLY